MASVLGNHSKLNQTLGRVAAAEDLIAQAVSIAREGQLPDLLAILLNMQAEVWLEGERWEAAQGLLDESRKIVAERPNREQQEMADMLWSVVGMRRGDKGERGRRAVKQAEGLYARSRDAELLVVIEDLRARINSSGANSGRP